MCGNIVFFLLSPRYCAGKLHYFLCYFSEKDFCFSNRKINRLCKKGNYEKKTYEVSCQTLVRHGTKKKTFFYPMTDTSTMLRVLFCCFDKKKFFKNNLHDLK